MAFLLFSKLSKAATAIHKILKIYCWEYRDDMLLETEGFSFWRQQMYVEKRINERNDKRHSIVVIWCLRFYYRTHLSFFVFLYWCSEISNIFCIWVSRRFSDFGASLNLDSRTTKSKQIKKGEKYQSPQVSQVQKVPREPIQEVSGVKIRSGQVIYLLLIAKMTVFQKLVY